MFGTNYYYALTRKYITVFGTLFNDISVTRTYTNNGPKTQTMKVPLTYGSYDKLLARDNEDPDLNRKIAATSPAMAFIAGAPVYDAKRSLQPTLQRQATVNGATNRQFVGSPWNIPFTLYIYADQEEDGLQILENILPYFTPALTITVKLMPEMNYEIDVPINLNNVEFENRSDGDLNTRRMLLWTLNFTMNAQFLGAMDTDVKGVIKKVIISVNDSLNVIEKDVDVVVQPGLTADGHPTNDISNTVPYIEIDATDDFGYITQFIGNN